ncbi:RyR domain-containing protein [Streptomyces sp. NPDC002785]|uniref:RyR domain-containing protein n=1 Tax=Streptomyces sp. NPDC002785 TaxID=3154543 RepID=UPI00331B187D
MVRTEEIVRVAHDAHRAWQSVTGDPASSPRWDEAPGRQRVSAIDGVRHAQSGATAEQLHDGWCDFEAADGWQYGPMTNEIARTHPCLVPYAELAPDQHRMDDLFQAVVTALSNQEA